jgi:hypothetical protein
MPGAGIGEHKAAGTLMGDRRWRARLSDDDPAAADDHESEGQKLRYRETYHELHPTSCALPMMTVGYGYGSRLTASGLD